MRRLARCRRLEEAPGPRWVSRLSPGLVTGVSVPLSRVQNMYRGAAVEWDSLQGLCNVIFLIECVTYSKKFV